MKTLFEVQKEIKKLKDSIISKGMGRLRASNIRKQKKLKELISKINEGAI